MKAEELRDRLLAESNVYKMPPKASYLKGMEDLLMRLREAGLLPPNELTAKILEEEYERTVKRRDENYAAGYVEGLRNGAESYYLPMPMSIKHRSDES